MIVEEPQECLECNQLTCTKCITQWKEKNNTCPNCRADLRLGTKLNRFVKQTLDCLEFVCETCSEKFTYEKRKEHWQSCGGSMMKCMVDGCDIGNDLFTDIDQLKEHWFSFCKAIVLTCSICET